MVKKIFCDACGEEIPISPLHHLHKVVFYELTNAETYEHICGSCIYKIKQIIGFKK